MIRYDFLFPLCRALLIACIAVCAASMVHAQDAPASSNADGLAAMQSGSATSAYQIWLPLAQNGDPIAQSNLGGLLLSGALGNPDYVGALDWFRKAAAQDNPAALVSLGHLYSAGLAGILPSDLGQATAYFRRAAELNSAEGAYFYGELLLRTGTKKTAVGAVESIAAAAQAGFPPAMHRLGTFLQSGAYTDRDVKKAVEWYEGAAKLGHLESTYQLGEIAMNGENGSTNLVAALALFEQAAERGHPDSLRASGYILLNGLAGAANPLRAAEMFRRAASLWDYRSMYHLGRQYLDGAGVKRDLLEAHKWFDLAAAGGHVEAHYMRAAVASNLTSEELRRARAMAQTWFDENHHRPHTHSSIEPHTH